VDPVIEIKITPNRPDALGIRGIAATSPRAARARSSPCPR
jgi:phenylalanyl-tRNA synthetase beta subunit